MSRALAANPIAWLQQYSWTARISKWGLCLVVIIIQLIQLAVGTQFLEDMLTLQFWLVAGLAIGFTFAGVNAFLEEKKNGALELLLITPLGVDQIIWGRVWGMWKQSFPAFVATVGFQLGTLWIFSGTYSSWRDPSTHIIITTDSSFFLAFFSLPFFATYAALRVKNLIFAALLTWVGVGLGYLFGSEIARTISWGDHPVLLICCLIITYSGFCALTFFLLRHSLSRRIYSF